MTHTHITPTDVGQTARVIDALEKAGQALRDAKQAMFFAHMPEYALLKEVADHICGLTATIAQNRMGPSHRVSLAKSMETRIAGARAHYEAQGEINRPYAREWLAAMEDVRRRILSDEVGLGMAH